MGERLRIRIEGSGVSAGIVAALLRQRDYAISLEAAGKVSRRVIAIPKPSVDLLHDLFGIEVDRMIESCWVIKRRVSWSSAEFVEVPSVALVCEAGELARALAGGGLQPTPPTDDGECVPGDSDWLVVAGGRSTGSRVSGGHRRAISGWVGSLPGFQSDAILIACVPSGWLFAAADPGGGIALVLMSPFVVGAAQHTLQETVDYLWPGCGSDVVVVGGYAAAPSFDPACAARGRISVGDAALALDPLRGDGVGFAARGGLLAQSVIAAIADGCDHNACLDHYAGRLMSVFRAHLNACISHYAAAWNAYIWSYEIEQMSRCLRGLTPDRAPDFRLERRDLIRI